MGKIIVCFNFIRLFPHYFIFVLQRNPAFQVDLEVWSRRYVDGANAKSNVISRAYCFLSLMTNYEEFRNLFYYRSGRISRLFRFLARPLPTLYVRSGVVGPGLFIQHGFATTIGAESIGSNCWINQQVTIGWVDSTGRPRIGNGVKISAGAKVLGNIEIGDNVKIGANAVVLKNVPPNCTVVGVPAYIVKINGVRVNQAL